MEAMRAQQEAFMQAMTGGMGGLSGMSAAAKAPDAPREGGDLDDIKAQLAALQRQLAKMSK